MWFDTWSQVLQVAITAAVAYGTLVIILRASGKRTLAKLNAFDFVVTVALGSTLATIATSSDVALAEGVTVLTAFIALQLAVAWLSVRIPMLRRAVKSEPVVVVHDGRMLASRIRQQRMSPEEVRQAIRSSGVGGLELVAAVVLETDGTLSVVTHQQLGSGSALSDTDAPLIDARPSEY